MAFGPIMQLQVGDVQLELAPVDKDNVSAFISPGMQQASVTQYLAQHRAPTIEEEVEWYEKAYKAKDSLIWGIWVLQGDQRLLIGTTALHDITKSHTIQAVSGSMIVDKAYWGKGIASAIHKARTWYAFQHYGLTRIKSAVIHGNIASRKALEKSGYNMVYVERNDQFVNGRLRHVDNLECLNPAEWAWQQWWGSDRPTKSATAARQRTRDAMTWAKENVTLL